MNSREGFLRCRAGLLAAAICLIAALWIVIAAGLPERRRANAVIPIGPNETPIAPEVGALAPPIEAADLNGKHFSLRALRGSPVVVNFWATWCGPCLVEMPLFQAAYGKYRAQGLRIVGIDANESPADVINWQPRFGLTYDLVIDRDQRIANLYRVRGLPSTYFVGRDGLIRQIAYGPLSDAALQSALADLLR